MTTFNEFVHKHNSKNKTTSNIKIKQVLSSLSLNDVVVFLRYSPFISDIGLVSLHPSKGTHWVCCINEIYFDSYGCVSPEKLSEFITQRKGYCLFSEYKIQGLTSKRDCNCASYCLYIVCLTKVMGIDFKSTVLNLYHQKKS